MTTDTQPTPNDLAYDIAIEINDDAIQFGSGHPNDIGQFSISKAAEIIRAHLAPLQAQAAQDHEEADAYAQVMVEKQGLQAHVANLEQLLLEANGTIRGVIHSLKLNNEQGVVSQCVHLFDELDELRIAKANLEKELAATNARHNQFTLDITRALNSLEPKVDRALANAQARLSGFELIDLERKRQSEEEGWTPEHDAKHEYGELAMAARCYVHAQNAEAPMPGTWPWDRTWWKPGPRIRNLIKAGALYQAEYDRCYRIGGTVEIEAKRHLKTVREIAAEIDELNQGMRVL